MAATVQIIEKNGAGGTATTRTSPIGLSPMAASASSAASLLACREITKPGASSRGCSTSSKGSPRRVSSSARSLRASASG